MEKYVLQGQCRTRGHVQRGNEERRRCYKALMFSPETRVKKVSVRMVKEDFHNGSENRSTKGTWDSSLFFP